jgi:Tfp pilus assembly protein PilF
VAGAMVEAGDYEPALTLLAALPLSHRQLPEVAYWRARGYEKLATAAYLQLYEADPNSYRLHQLMGDLEASRGDDRKAMEEYRDAVAAKPSIPNLHYSLGHLLWKNLDVSGARSELEAELSINPHHAGALHDLGNTYLLEHQPEKALQYLNRALAIEPDSPDIHLDIGTAYTQLSQFQKAEAEYKIALPTDHDGSIHYKLAKVYQSLKRNEDAAREFAISSEMNRQSHDKLEKQTQRLAEIEQLPQ